jgi:hypothetical protein
VTYYEQVARKHAHVDLELGATLDFTKLFNVRDRLVQEYAWAIPNEAALDEIAANGPVLEIGAGSGYWAWELEQREVDILAFDPDPFRKGQYAELRDGTVVPRIKWGEVAEGDHTEASSRAHRHRSLLICWPTWGDPWATKAVQGYLGDTIFYVGEMGGATGDETLVPALCLDFKLTDRIQIPRYEGIHDDLTIWRR